MKIYIVIINDRYSDLEVWPFVDLESAKAWAREKAREYCVDEYVFIVDKELENCTCAHFAPPNFCNHLGDVV